MVRFEVNGYFTALFLYFFQYNYVLRTIKQFEDAMNLNKNVTSILNLVKLIVSVMYLEHLFACLWYFIYFCKILFAKVLSRSIFSK